ncbi:MAG: NAD(P)H-dependent oxidoreductase [Asgard group archaeon]|nr:NAD(P)H-dependent oxidoreductase [Asgard group archaeon]
MNVLVIYAHPNENSFCSAIKNKLLSGLEKNINSVRIHDLYYSDFNPILTKKELIDYPKALSENEQVQKHQHDIKWADIICLIYPVWWYGPPAILKGYIDRVITEGFAYDYIDNQAIPKLTDKRMILIQTFDAEEKMEKELNEDISYKSMHNIWNYCGINEINRVSLFRVNFVDKKQRNVWLEEIYKLGCSIK